MGINVVIGNVSTLNPSGAVISNATKPGAVTPTDKAPASLTPPKPVVTKPANDTIKLSGKALAKSLKLAGQNPVQIALKMGVNVKTVEGYLGLSTK